MSKSYLAKRIDEEYRREKAFRNKKRQPCKTKDCRECNFFNICTERNDMYLNNIVEEFIKDMRGRRIDE